ncbi:MAG: tyrosine-type recombinase/integrase [Planctomycetaceae bacterium]|nr:tyrosine-type recombinase/integrase [Planctomycetaceae bacterium]
MPHFPKPFFKKSHQKWYVEIRRRQHCLGSDRDEAFRRYYELMNQPDMPAPPPEAINPTQFVTIVDAFLDWVQKHRSPDTFEWYRYRLERFCRKYPDLRAAELRPYHVQRWVDGYDQLSRTSKRNYVRTVKRCCQWAMQQGYLTQNPVQLLEVPGAERREMLITAEEFATLLTFVRDEALRDLILVTWETGCRPQESLRVEARHVDMARNRWVFNRSESKGKRQPRVVYLSELAAEITRRRVEAFPAGPILRNSSGQPWTTESVNCHFGRIQVRMLQASGLIDDAALEAEIQAMIAQLSQRPIAAGVKSRDPKHLRAEARRKVLAQHAKANTPRYSLYALRHAWATRALQSGLDGLTVAILMGHSDPSTLARVYQHLAHQPEHLLAQARKAIGQ